MRVDKKSRGDLLRFIVLDGLAKPAVLEGPTRRCCSPRYAEVADVSPPVLVLNGPNLGRLGTREPESTAPPPTPGSSSSAPRSAELGFDVEVRETNDEGEMIRWLHEAADGSVPVVLNPGPSRTIRTACGTRRRSAPRR